VEQRIMDAAGVQAQQYDSEVNDRDQVFVDCMDTHANAEQRHGRPSESDETDPRRSAPFHNWRPMWGSKKMYHVRALLSTIGARTWGSYSLNRARSLFSTHSLNTVNSQNSVELELEATSIFKDWIFPTTTATSDNSPVYNSDNHTSTTFKSNRQLTAKRQKGLLTFTWTSTPLVVRHILHRLSILVKVIQGHLNLPAVNQRKSKEIATSASDQL